MQSREQVLLVFYKGKVGTQFNLLYYIGKVGKVEACSYLFLAKQRRQSKAK